jgi:hypothetical protein
MSSHEFAEWIAYSQLSPFGDGRADLRMAILAATMVNMWKGKDDDKAATPDDFMPQFEKNIEEPAISKEDAIAAIDAAFTAYAMMSNAPKSRD